MEEGREAISVARLTQQYRTGPFEEFHIWRAGAGGLGRAGHGVDGKTHGLINPFFVFLAHLPRVVFDAFPTLEEISRISSGIPDSRLYGR